jgi:osmotically-inducible protein OsmY
MSHKVLHRKMDDVSAEDVKKEIENALRRYAEAEARVVLVETTGGKVTLRGRVHSWHEWSETIQAARRVSGVTSVDDQLVIRP